MEAVPSDIGGVLAESERKRESRLTNIIDQLLINKSNQNAEGDAASVTSSSSPKGSVSSSTANQSDGKSSSFAYTK